jgi:hypothetical protein
MGDEPAEAWHDCARYVDDGSRVELHRFGMRQAELCEVVIDLQLVLAQIGKVDAVPGCRVNPF